MMTNILRALQANPLNYRHFGAYWWRVKRELRVAGRAPEWCGDNTETWAEIDAMPAEEFWPAAFAEAHTNAVLQHLENHVWSPDGEPYKIRDTDVEP